MAERPSTRLRLLTAPPDLHVVKDRICSNCDHGTLGRYGVHCTLFHEDIDNEKVAEDCEMYEP